MEIYSLELNWENITLKTKLQIFNSNVKSILLYASETWTITNNIADKIQVFLNCCLRLQNPQT